MLSSKDLTLTELIQEKGYPYKRSFAESIAISQKTTEIEPIIIMICLFRKISRPLEVVESLEF
uniref:Uncharacterized protein n=1 Tax=Cucumis melo TaxID=3656 RepID=A0A9I9E125_CUCME